MVRSHTTVMSFIATIIILHTGVVISMNCDSSRFPFCSDQGSVGRRVYLSGVDNRTNGIGCNCSISLATYNQDPVKIEIKNATIHPYLCDYNLYFVYRNKSARLYGCDDTVHRDSFDLEPMETVRLHMETQTYNGVGFPFCLQLFTERGSDIILRCSRPTPQSTTTTTNASPTAFTSTNSSSTNNSTTTIYDTQDIPISSTWRIEDATKPQTNDDDSDRLIGIIIGSIIAVLVIASVIITVCLMKRRKKDIIYETPQQPQQSSHIYTDLHVEPVNTRTQQNNIYVNSVVI